LNTRLTRAIACISPCPRDRQTVDKHHDIRTAVIFVFDDGELISCQPVVVIRILKIDQPDFIVFGVVFGLVFNIYAIG
jgi:hypothetical protein